VRSAAVLTCCALAGASLAGSEATTRARSVQEAGANATVTRVPGIRVGHFTLATGTTGCTVILAPPNTVGAVDVRGGAPGTVETDVLRPENAVSAINAVFLSGGSAFGLATRDGVMDYLSAQKIGYHFGGAYIPIVSGAIIFDIPVGRNATTHPDKACGAQAAANATAGPVAEGSVGVGAGATVGKFTGNAPMKGGVGSTAFVMSDGLIVAALVVTNASGSIVDPDTGKPVAGVRGADGKSLEDPFALVRRGMTPSGSPIANTTLGVVVTNATLSKAEATKVATMAHDGFARAIVPVHTSVDGDTIFTLATGTTPADYSRVGVLAAAAMSDAILRSVRAAKGLPGYPSVVDIR
jgi:L-aminopeptidase/D-esterase-like protein